MHQQTTTQGTTQHTKEPWSYPWQGHALNGPYDNKCMLLPSIRGFTVSSLRNVDDDDDTFYVFFPHSD
ncbi:hypothetical protein ACSQ67_003352 [Phaseolus vulgaris]